MTDSQGRASLFASSRDPESLFIELHRAKSRRHSAIANALSNGTYDALMAHERWVPVRSVAGFLGISEQGANNRLRHLVDVGVAERRHVDLASGGRLYEYQWLARLGS